MGVGDRGYQDLREARAAAAAAARRNLGAYRSGHRLQGRSHGLGLVSGLLGVVLLAPGIGLLMGPYSAAVRAMAVSFLVVAVVGPAVGIWLERRLSRRAARLHLFDGGVVITGRHDDEAWTAAEVDVAEAVETTHYGQGPQQHSSRWVTLRAGDRLLARFAADSGDAQALLAWHRREATSGSDVQQGG